jgi:hypothetical protein
MPRRVLIQLDCDPQPSTFDAVVAVDAGVDVLLRHGGVTADNVVPLVSGAMFTRGGVDLAATAIFVGGSDVAAAEEVCRRVSATFFGPVRVGVLLDPSGANTTAAAAVIAAACHLALAADAAPTAERVAAVVLGGTGPVGQRVARLLAGRGAAVTLVSRDRDRAAAAAARIGQARPGAAVEPLAVADFERDVGGVLSRAGLVVAAGAAGATLLPRAIRERCSAAVYVDLNAVPPAGIEGIAATDKARPDGRAVCYGALGVGGTKMKIHKAAIARLFSPDAPLLDAEELLAIGATV